MTNVVQRSVLWRTPDVRTTPTIRFLSSVGWVLSHVEHRLYWRVCNAVGSVIRGRSLRCVLSIGADSKMLVLLDDPYWSRMVTASYDYEPELRRTLDQLNDLEFDVLDCGANFGYWSILLSGPELGRRRVIAVEPSESTFDVLRTNCSLNAERFRCARLAITSMSGQEVSISAPEGHPGAHVTEKPSAERCPTTHVVETTSLDDLVDDFVEDPHQRVVVKLDVEGQEVNAFLGAKRMLQDRDVLFLYEDFGGDSESQVTKFVLEVLKLRVFFSQATGGLIEIFEAAEASALKTRKTYGYNFIACRAGSAFLDHLGV